MSVRSVRKHLHNLEHAYGKILREHRGEFTSDGIWLLAPAHSLRPPRKGDAWLGWRPAFATKYINAGAIRRTRRPAR